MKTSELIFVGIKGSVVALNRANGTQVWVAPLKGTDFVNVVVEDGKILAATHGEIFYLDPFTGRQLWHNPLKGYGFGLATIATEKAAGNGSTVAQAEKQRRDQAAAAAGAASAAVVM